MYNGFVSFDFGLGKDISLSFLFRGNMFSKIKNCDGKCSECDRFSERGFSLGLVEVKRKVSTKYVEPDMSAIKLLYEFSKQKEEDDFDFDGLSNEELLAKKKELLRILNEENESN